MRVTVDMSSKEEATTDGETAASNNTSADNISSSDSTTTSNGTTIDEASKSETTKAATNNNKPEDDFSDYMWMENMEEYDQEIMRQLEEDIMISHYTDIYEDSLLEDGSPGPTTASLCVTSAPILPPLGNPSDDLDEMAKQMRGLNFTSSASSRLNPNAAEFVPKGMGN